MPKLQYDVLHVEDSADDAELVALALARSGLKCNVARVDNERDYVAALDQAPDIVLCDYEMPQFSAERAMRLLQERHSDVPFIVVSNHIGQSDAVVAMQQGASDYLSKRDLGRLRKSIEAAVERAMARRAEAEALESLRVNEALTRGILDSLDSRIAVIDGRGVILAVNPAWVEFGAQRVLLGLPSAKPGDNYLDLLDRALAEGWAPARDGIEQIRRVVARESRFATMDYEVAVDGSTRWFHARVLALEGSADGVVLSHTDITEPMLAHLSLERAHHRLQVLSKRVLSIQEEERHAIARELHDDLGQTLAALKIGLHRLADKPAGDAGLVNECLSAAEDAIARVRRMSQDLHPPQLEQLGLTEAIAWLAERHGRSTGVQVACDFSSFDGDRAPRSVETACYRIAQEAINNATRHAAPKSVALALVREGNLIKLSVRDDGSGFDEAAARDRALKSGSLGMISMEERAELAGGRLKVRTAPGQGTLVTATFPVGAAAR